MTLTYRPSWSVDTESLDTFSLRGFDAHGELVFGRTDTDPAGRLDDTTIADVIKAGIGAFTTMVASNLRAKFALPVPYPIMRRRIGPALFRAVSALPQRDRLMHLRIEICGIPNNATVNELLDIREFFRGRVRDIAFLMPLGRINDQILALDHVALGADIPAAMLEDDARRQLTAFRRMTGGRRVSAMGLRTATLVGDMVKLGFDEVTGAGLADDLRALPSRVTVMHRTTLTRGDGLDAGAGGLG